VSSLIAEPHDDTKPRNPAGIQVETTAPDVDVDVVEIQMHIDPPWFGQDPTRTT
jgi:hypothetical protein